tara:strand:- start:1023 stop:1262 length:240 start_codon:yes stop_codon:yes gene_type:complete
MISIINIIFILGLSIIDSPLRSKEITQYQETVTNRVETVTKEMNTLNSNLNLLSIRLMNLLPKNNLEQVTNYNLKEYNN